MITLDSRRSIRSLMRRLGQARRELVCCESESGKVLLVCRGWLKDALETRVCELENRIVIHIGVGDEKE